jgi:hypothetical protein
MKRTLLLMLFLLSAFTLMRCKRCKQEELPDKKFTQQEQAIIPYAGSETLTFKDSSGDSVCYTGQGRISTMNLNHEVMDWDGEECQGDYRQIESVSLNYKGTNSDTTIGFRMRFYHAFNDYENDKIFSLSISYSTPNMENIFYGSFSFELNTLINNIHGQLPLQSYISAFHDTLTILNKKYYSVYELTWDTSNILPQYQHLFVSSVYYSISQGLVGYKKTTGAIWYLD